MKATTTQCSKNTQCPTTEMLGGFLLNVCDVTNHSVIVSGQHDSCFTQRPALCDLKMHSHPSEPISKWLCSMSYSMGLTVCWELVHNRKLPPATSKLNEDSLELVGALLPFNNLCYDQVFVRRTSLHSDLISS